MDKMESKLRNILETLGDLEQRMVPLGLQRTTVPTTSSRRLPTTSSIRMPTISSIRMPTTSPIPQYPVCGRNFDKETIIEWLLSHHGNGENCDLLPIVGMGGIGKTTLAQLIYNDVRVHDHFDLKVWIYVSQEFDIPNIIKNIFLAVSSATLNDTITEDRIQQEAVKRLTGKKFFLVLDDVWSSDLATWDSLLLHFRSVMEGSKIIFTTRSADVASIRSTTPPYFLGLLADDDCWSLFAHQAFDGEYSDVNPELRAIGREIVSKCGGLPLAAATLGSLLRFSRDVHQWREILHSHLLNLHEYRVWPDWILNFNYLSPNLKQCFVYFALFPRDYEFQKEELLRLWIAEGFVEPKPHVEAEEVADDYFNDLLSGSFLQPSVNPRNFVMHDVVHHLAELMSMGFYFRWEDYLFSGKPTKMTRYLSFACNQVDIDDGFAGISEAQFLRSFLLVKCRRNKIKGLHFLLRLHHLRVLSLLDCYNIVELPNSISNLKHLRYLELSDASIKILPEVVGVLYNLQILILKYCKALVGLPNSIGNLKHLRNLDLRQASIERLPESITSLCNLRSLILFGCTSLNQLPANMERLVNLCHLDIGETMLQSMPSHLGMLTKLQTLTDFRVAPQSGSGLKELGKLQRLQGRVRIWNLENAEDAQDVLEANLMGMKYLSELQLSWNDDIGNSVHILEQLRPHRNVQSLHILGYGGASFPNWVGDSSFSNMVALHLNGCKNCSSLPPLGQLESLENLHIQSFDVVEAIGQEFYGSSKRPFKSLKSLTFTDMPRWNVWLPEVNVDECVVFPVLQKLHMQNCPNLTHALPKLLLSLKTLCVEGCEQLAVSLLRLPAILEMTLRDSCRYLVFDKMHSGLHRLEVSQFHGPDFPLNMLEPADQLLLLGEIRIERCGSLVLLPLELFPKLKTLYIFHCQNLESLRAKDELHRNDSSVSCLTITMCRNLKSLPVCMDSLVELKLKDCPALESFPEWGFSSKLESLEIWRCEKLFSARFNWPFKKLPSLSEFSIGGCGGLKSFPEKISLPSTLLSLSIWNLANLKSLDPKGLRHLTSLKELSICGCPLLQFTPQEGLPSTITSLGLYDLENLESPECKWLQQLIFLERLKIYNCPKLRSMPEEDLPSSVSFLGISGCPLLEQRRDQQKGDDER